MKPQVKAFLFLVIITVLDFLFRKGLLSILIPFPLSQQYSIGFLFVLFAISALLVTKWFCNKDGSSLNDLGISLSKPNRFDFIYGFLVGVVLWAIVCWIQSAVAGFSWELRPDFNYMSLLYGLLFIFIADLGTELYTRGYPLTRLKDSFGSISAIVIMVFFVGCKSISFDQSGPLLFYAILIPVLHTIFFSIIYFKTKRLGPALGVHTGANFITISIFDLRLEQPGQAIPAGLFQSNTGIEGLSMHALQLPYVIMAIAFSVAVYLWWMHSEASQNEA